MGVRPSMFTAVFGLFLMLAGCSGDNDASNASEKAARPVKSVVLMESAGGESYNFPGKVYGADRVELSFRVSGPLIELPVKKGEEVEKGALIARIDPRDFETSIANIKSELAKARSQLSAMKTGERPEDIRVLEAEVAAARAQYEDAREQFKRKAELYSRDIVSKAEYERFMADRNVKKARLDSAVQNLKKGRKGARKEDVAAMESQIQGLLATKKKTEDALLDTYLKAPFSGVVSEKFVENFQDVQAKTPIVKLQDISELEIRVNVPEKVMALARKGRGEASAVFDFAPDKKFKLALKEYGTQADPNTNTFPVTLTMTPPEDLSILPGMTATVHVEGLTMAEEKERGFMVPVHAVFADEKGASFVWVVAKDTNKVARRAVKVGPTGGSEILVTEGVKAGERIVTAGVAHLDEGDAVRPMNGEKGGGKP